MTIAAIVQPDNVAVVTGAALGVGRAMCKRFAEAGMSVVLADLPSDELDSAVHAIGALSPRGPPQSSLSRPMSPIRSRSSGYATLLLSSSARSTCWPTTPRRVSDAGKRLTWPTGEKQWTSTSGGPIIGVRAFYRQ